MESSAEPVLLNVDMAKPGDDVIVLVVNNAYCLRVVAEGRGWTWWEGVHLSEEAAEGDEFLDASRESSELSFCGGVCHSRLVVRSLDNWSSVEEDDVALRRAGAWGIRERGIRCSIDLWIYVVLVVCDGKVPRMFKVL